MDEQTKIIIIGAGAAGLMAALAAARQGASVVVLEKNAVPGRKLAMTGNGRCNLTHFTDPPGIIRSLPGNGKFLSKAVYRFGPSELMSLMENLGVRTKVEEDGRVFPVSDRSQDVIAALSGELKRLGVELRFGESVKGLSLTEGTARGVVLQNGQTLMADAVIVCTGGASYPATGSTGDGYRLAKEAGHTVIPIRPSLVPLVSNAGFLGDLQGVSLSNVGIRAYRGDKLLAEERGDLLFTHYGLSGPGILIMSRLVVAAWSEDSEGISIGINQTADSDEASCDVRVRKIMEDNSRKTAKNMLEQLLPHKMVAAFISILDIDPLKPVHQLTKEDRRGIVRLLTDLRVPIAGSRPLAEATITAGGVSTKELNPQTMESRLVSGLYFAGEVIDVDGFTGGYNLQAAFSMGYAAGEAAGSKVKA